MIQEFKRAASVDEAVKLQREGYVILAGGTQVNNTPFRKRGKKVEKVVSIDALNLTGIGRDGDGYVIGAGVTLQELADSDAVPAALKRAAGFIPTRSVRNIATIGGNVGAKRSDSYLIPALIALGAEAETPSGTVSVEEYVGGEQDDLIISFRIPGVKGVCEAVKESRSHLALPVVSAAVRIAVEGKAVKEAVVAAGCVAKRTIRLPEVEKGIVSGELLAERALEDAIAKSIKPSEDFLGGSAYKTWVNSAVIADCVRRCIEEASK